MGQKKKIHMIILIDLEKSTWQKSIFTWGHNSENKDLEDSFLNLGSLHHGKRLNACKLFPPNLLPWDVSIV